MLSGDIIPLVVDPSNDVLSIKIMIREEKKDELVSSYSIKLFNMEGDELYDKDRISDKINNEDMINLFIDVMPDPPFKGKRWINFKTTDKEVEPPLKKHIKKLNPALKDGRPKYVLKKYEGTFNEFIKDSDEYQSYIITSIQLDHLTKFIKIMNDLVDKGYKGYNDLMYVYAAVYFDTDIDFIATNYDGSIVYEYERTSIGANNYIYINGVKLRLISDWFKSSDERRLDLLRL